MSFENSGIDYANNIKWMGTLWHISHHLAGISTIIAIIIAIIKKLNDRNKSSKLYKFSNRWTNLANNILFYSVAVFTVISAIMFLIVFQDSKFYMLKDIGFNVNFPQDTMIIPRFYGSLIWWIAIWMLMVVVLAYITKVTHFKNHAIIYGF